MAQGSLVKNRKVFESEKSKDPDVPYDLCIKICIFSI